MLERQESGKSFQMVPDQLRELGAFALGAVEVAAVSHPSPEVREFAQQQLAGWVRHGYIEEAS